MLGHQNVAVVHEFQTSVDNPAHHCQLRHPNPDKVLIDNNDKAVNKVQGNAYRQDYLHNHNKAFLPLIMSTSGLHGEFVRLLYVLDADLHWFDEDDLITVPPPQSNSV